MTDDGRVGPQGLGEAGGGRYRLTQRLGAGGMAVVYQAIDLIHDRRVALKRLKSERQREPAVCAQFEQEYVTLAQLSHPRIVSAHDYSFDAVGPYYTMELLDGGDLAQIAPADYRTACALARDVCSALSLVHSRRLVYRDLSVNNVRQTSDGQAKLIDFGALAPVGVNHAIIGTLPCLAPEVVKGGVLDARTDLYALGATLYYLLTRRHPFSPRTIDDLKKLWRTVITPPSELAASVPVALDRLVLDLLKLDPSERPANAAEVMERLSAIAGLARDESLLVEESYLATPALVARDAELALAREHLVKARQGNGSSLLIVGPSGAGRSRLLEAIALQAKLSGALVVRADTLSDRLDDLSVFRAIARSLVEQLPIAIGADEAPYVAVVRGALPELFKSSAPFVSEAVADGLATRIRVQAALRDWLRAAAVARPLMILADDVDRMNPLGAALVTLMAREASRRAIVLVATRSTEDGPDRSPSVERALKLLTQDSELLPLLPLSTELTERLLGSVFGQVPHLITAAQHIQHLSGGLPRDVLRMARHLVAEGVARYEAGAWSLPERLSAADLPSSMADALARRVQALEEPARMLAYAIAAEPDLAFSPQECAQLVPLSEVGLAACLDALIGAELVRSAEGGVRAAASAKSAPLEAALDEATVCLLHTRLSSLCQQRGEAIRRAQHLLRAGLEAEALDVLVPHALESAALTERDPNAFFTVLRSLPEGWLATFEQCIAACDRLKRPRSEKRSLQIRLTGFFSATSGEVVRMRHVQELSESLAYDAGLDLWATLPADMEPRARALSAMARAEARRRASADGAASLAPGPALKELTSTVVVAVGLIAYTNSYEEWRQLPSLEPFCPLSPGIALVHALVQGVGTRIAGRSEETIAIYQDVLERISAPDAAGLSPAHALATRFRLMGALGVLHAMMGQVECLALADKISDEPRYESISLVIQQLHALFQGQASSARELQQRLEALRLERSANHPSEAHVEFAELMARALAGDLTGVRRSYDALSSRADLYPPFRAARSFARGEYHRLRGDPGSALSELSDALGLMKPGEDMLWSLTARAQVYALCDLARAEEACAVAAEYWELSASLGYMRNFVRMAWSAALLARGEYARATALAEATLSELLAGNVDGLTLGVAYEHRARVAEVSGDLEAFHKYTNLRAAQRRASRRSFPLEQYSLRAPGAVTAPPAGYDGSVHLRSTLAESASLAERLTSGLTYLVRQMQARAGALWIQTSSGLTRAADFGDTRGDLALDAWAQGFFEREVVEYVTDPTSAARPSTSTSAHVDGLPYLPILLGHDGATSYVFTGLVVLLGGDPAKAPLVTGLATELSRIAAQLEEQQVTI